MEIFMKKKKILCVLLAALMLSSSVTMLSCGESDVNSETTQGATNTPDASNSTEITSVSEEDLTDYELRQLVSDDLPAVTYNGADFRVLTHATVNGFDYTTEIAVDELTGDVCNDAVYNRNIKIEDRFDVQISVTSDSTPYSTVKTFSLAGTDDYHIVGFYDYLAYVPITAGVLLNWLDAPYVNLDKPWHNSLANDDATINDILYAICSDLSITSMTYTHAIFFNVDLVQDYGYTTDDLYNLVKEGKWTIDQFNSIVSEMYIDKNGNGTADTSDSYGFGYYICNPADVWLTAFGGKIVQKNENGEIELTFMNDKTVAILEKLLTLHYDNPGFIKLSAQYDEETYFLENKLVFAPMRFHAAYNTLREMDSVYSMLPYPKWDEEQEAYYTNADDKFTVFGLPLPSYSELDFVSTIFEALCAESYKEVYPAYYDQALKGKYSSDPTTAEMVDLIMSGRAFDFAFQFGETYFQNLPYKIRNMISANNKNLTSDYKKSEKALKKSLTKLQDAYSGD